MSTPIIMNIVTQRSVSDKAQTPMNVARFYPDGPQLTGMTGNSTFGWGGAGVNANFGVAATREMQYTRIEGVSFDGKRSGKSKLTWVWKVDDVSLEDGLEDPCEFWVMIPPVEKGVKVDFKVTCQVRSTKPVRDKNRRLTYAS